MRELSPLLVTSPTVRSGTTLVQRLLCSASNALVYGEEIGKDLEMQLQIHVSRKLIYTHSRSRFTHDLQRVVQGAGDGWIVDLMPDVDGYLQALHEGAFAGLGYCRDHAERAGRPVWGFKYPGWPPHMLRQMFDVLPGTRVVYVVRPLADTARSAKAWGAVEPGQMQAFCTQWLQHLLFMQQWRQDHAVLMLPYATLVSDPDQALAQLQAFLPLQAMDRSVLERRINGPTHGLDTRQDAAGYVPPATLDAGEQQCVDATVAAAREAGLGSFA